ncbi:hypothetical protein BLOT_000135 [Blomia tropicalis]|nr:hypothetical protein BLOT_000135 [Blomia tropicalis]
MIEARSIYKLPFDPKLDGDKVTCPIGSHITVRSCVRSIIQVIPMLNQRRLSNHTHITQVVGKSSTRTELEKTMSTTTFSNGGGDKRRRTATTNDDTSTKHETSQQKLAIELIVDAVVSLGEKELLVDTSGRVWSRVRMIG